MFDIVWSFSGNLYSAPGHLLPSTWMVAWRHRRPCRLQGQQIQPNKGIKHQISSDIIKCHSNISTFINYQIYHWNILEYIGKMRLVRGEFPHMSDMSERNGVAPYCSFKGRLCDTVVSWWCLHQLCFNMISTWCLHHCALWKMHLAMTWRQASAEPTRDLCKQNQIQHLNAFDSLIVWYFDSLIVWYNTVS